MNVLYRIVCACCMTSSFASQGIQFIAQFPTMNTVNLDSLCYRRYTVVLLSVYPSLENLDTNARALGDHKKGL
jgi:hypothetical protein